MGVMPYHTPGFQENISTIKITFLKESRSKWSLFENANRKLFESEKKLHMALSLTSSSKESPIIYFKTSFEIGGIPVIKGFRQVLVKVVLFQLGGHCHNQDAATPNCFSASKSSIIRLSNEDSFISGFFKEDG